MEQSTDLDLDVTADPGPADPPRATPEEIVKAKQEQAECCVVAACAALELLEDDVTLLHQSTPATRARLLERLLSMTPIARACQNTR